MDVASELPIYLPIYLFITILVSSRGAYLKDTVRYRAGVKGARQKRRTVIAMYRGDRATRGSGKKSFSNGLKFHSAVSHCEAAKPETRMREKENREP